MGTKRRILSAALLVGILGVLALIFLWPRGSGDPVYQGKPLGAWLRNYDYDITRKNPTAAGIADDAVRHLGTNAIPALLRRLRARDSGFKLWLIEWGKAFSIVSATNYSVYAETGAEETEKAFAALGANAIPAVPALIEIYRRNYSEASQIRVARILGGIGPAAKAAVPALVEGWQRNQGSTDTSMFVRGGAIIALGQIHPEPEFAVPVMAKALHDPLAGVRATAAMTLGEYAAGAKAAVPDLTGAVKDADSDVRRYAIITLGLIGEPAREAVPELLNAVKDTNQVNSFQAGQAVWRIDSKAARAAGLK